MGDLLQPWHLLVLAVIGIPIIAVLWLIPLWFICRKAGFSPWLTLLNCIPFGTTLLLYLLAFADWKHVRDDRRSPSSQPVA